MKKTNDKEKRETALSIDEKNSKQIQTNQQLYDVGLL